MGGRVVRAREEDRLAIQVDVVGNRVRWDDHFASQILRLIPVLLLQNQTEMVQANLTIEKSAGEVHGEVLNPHGRIPARRDGPEAECVGARTAGGARRDTAGVEHRPGRGFKKYLHVSGNQGFGWLQNGTFISIGRRLRLMPPAILSLSLPARLAGSLSRSLSTTIKTKNAAFLLDLQPLPGCPSIPRFRQPVQVFGQSRRKVVRHAEEFVRRAARSAGVLSSKWTGVQTHGAPWVSRIDELME